MELKTNGYKTTYLNTKLEEEIYVDIPEGYKNCNTGKY